MPIIYSYPIATPTDTDLLIISRVPTDPDEISNFSVTTDALASFVTARVNLTFVAELGGGIVNLDTQALTVNGTANEIETSGSGQALTIGLPDNVTITNNLSVGGDVQIDTLTNDYIPVNRDPGVLRDSVIYQDYYGAADPRENAVALNTTHTDTNFGEYPDLRVASRQDDDFAVLDLFRRDNNVSAGETAGMLQYSVQDDGRYTIAQIAVETLATSGAGDSGGGKFVFKTTRGGGSGGGANTPESRFTLDKDSADFSVPVNVTSTTQSSFAGQVTIPLTPIQNTDAASKGYVDSQDLQIEGDTGTGSINLDTQVFDVAGGTYIDTAANGQTVTADLSAVDGTAAVGERYLTKNNTWATVASIPGTYTFNVSADTGAAQTINTTETLLLAGGTYINTSVGIGPEVTFNHDNTTLTTTSSSSSPGAGGSFSVIDSITTNLQGHVTNINTLTVTLPSGGGTDNYVDGGAYSSVTGILTLSRTGGLADVTASGFLQLGTTSTTALAGDTTTITQTQANDIVVNNAKVSFPEAPTDGQQYARQNAGWSVVSGSGGGGVGGNGTVNTIPIWSTTTVLSDSLITQDNTGVDPIFDFNSIVGTNQYTPPTNTVLYKLKSGNENKFSITQDGGGGVVLPSGDILNNGPSFNMGGNAFANGENALSVGAATTAFGNGSFAANFLTLASGGGASAFGLLTEATALASVAFGNKSQSTGNYSIAAGQDSIASGQSSVAIGEKGEAQGKNTFVQGFGGTATANNAVKFGYEGSASGNNSAKFGFESVASGANSLAVGTGTIAGGLQSIATGDNNTVSGFNSFVGGKNSDVAGSSSFAFGQANTVSSLTSAAFGQSNTVNGFQSFAAGWNNNTNNYGNQILLGIGLSSSQYESVLLGRYNDNTDVYDKFQIGNGSDSNNRSNALSINGAGHVKLPTYGSGNVIGTATHNLSVDANGTIIETTIDVNTNYSVQVLTANATGQKNYLYVLQGSSAIELTLPASPSSGDSIKVSNLTTVTTCTINPGSERIMSIPQIMTLDNNKAAFELIYVGPAYGWVIVGATGEI